MALTAHPILHRAATLLVLAVASASLVTLVAPAADASTHATVTFRAKSDPSTNAGSTMTIPKPAGVVAGDALIAQITQTQTSPPATPAGWTALPSTSVTNKVAQYVYYRLATADDASEAVTGYAFTNVHPPSATGVVLAYRNVDPATPFNAASWADAVATGAATSSSLTAPAITPADPHGLRLALFGYGGSSAHPTALDGMTQRHTRSGANPSVSSWDQQLGGAGADDAKSFSLTSSDWVAHSIVLRAAGAPAAADLQFSQVQHREEVAPEGLALWRMHVLNAGPSPAAGVTVALQLAGMDPADLFVCSQQGPTCHAETTQWDTLADLGAFDSATGTVSLGELAAGGLSRFQLRLVVPADADDAAVYSVAASVGSATLDPDMGNNAVGPLQTVVHRTDALTATIAGPASAIPGRTVTYTAFVENDGPVRPTGVVASFSLDPSLTAAEYCVATCPEWLPLDDSGRVDLVASLATRVRVRVRATVPADLRPEDLDGGVLAASVSGEAVNAQPSAPASTEAELDVRANVRVTVGYQAARTVNQWLTYTVRVTNLGPSSAQGVSASAALDERLEGVARYCVGDDCDLGEHPSWDLVPESGQLAGGHDLAPGETTQIRVRMRVPGPATDTPLESTFEAWPGNPAEDHAPANNTVSRSTSVS